MDHIDEESAFLVILETNLLDQNEDEGQQGLGKVYKGLVMWLKGMYCSILSIVFVKDQ